MDINRLRCFVVVAEELNLHRAATRLGITQPAITTQIATLEEELGLDLLIRDHQRIVALTNAGASFAKDVRRVLSELSHAGRSAQALADGKQGVYRLGLCEEVSSPRLQELFKYCLESLPGHVFQFAELPADELEAALLSREIDAAFAYLPAADLALASDLLWTEQWLAAFPNENPLAARTSVTCQDLAETDLILSKAGPNTPADELVRGNFRAARVKPRIAAEVVRRTTMLALAAAGLGTTFLPRSFQSLSFTALKLVPLEGRGITTYCLYAAEQAESLASCLSAIRAG